MPTPIHAAAKEVNNAQACVGVLPDPDQSLKAKRSITIDDLIGLRDVGPDTGGSDGDLSISPDGRTVAFVVTRGDAESNSYCQGLVALELRVGAKATLLDRGGGVKLALRNLRGALVRQGARAVVTPRWSPDGRWIAYPKYQDGVARVWVVGVHGGGARAITPANIDVEEMAWSQDGKSILFSHRPDLKLAERAQEREGRSGYLVDGTIVPYVDTKPMLRATVATSVLVADATSGMVRPASASEEALIGGANGPSSGMRVVARDGRRAWTEKDEPNRLLSRTALWAEDSAGRAHKCDDHACQLDRSGLSGLWWTKDSTELLFLRREGWGRSQLGLYRWRPGNPPRRILATDDILTGCRIADHDLLCAREGSVNPRHLVLIDIATGRSQTLFDPNPEFKAILLGKVERLRWRNDAGLECYGDLVLPADYLGGERLPMMVVQYSTRGFLRGGVGDEYPIQIFADRGYAVLSLNNPAPFYETLPDAGWQTWQEAEVENTKEWRGRRSVHSSLIAGVRLVHDRGIIDARRIGLTGLSDGSATTQFALINSPGLFAAASVAACCLEPTAMMTYGGLALAETYKGMGFPAAKLPDLPLWKSVSLAQNAETINTPLLMHLSDHGFLLGLETFMGLREAGKAVDAYVFPNEYHIKWQPAHRSAIYTRNLDWFDFWLRGEEDDDPAKREQYRRWEAMRRSQVFLGRDGADDGGASFGAGGP